MSSRSGSVRLRSALGKLDQSEISTSIFSSSPLGITMASEKSSRSSRRTNGHSLVNGSYSNNGNGGSTSTRSQSRTRGNSSGSGMSAMEVDGDDNLPGSGVVVDNPGDEVVSSVNNDSVSDNKSNNGGNSTSNNSSKGVAGGGSNNGTSTNITGPADATANCSNTGADSNSMEVEDSSSDTSSSDSSDSSDSEDSSEMDDQISETRKQAFRTDMESLDSQFEYLRELLYHERMTQITSKLEEVRSGKATEYLGPLAQLQDNMRIRMEVIANLRQFRLINVQHKFDAEDLAIRQNFESGKQLMLDSIKSELEEKIRRLEEDRNNDFTSELWLETALKKKNKKSIDLFGDKKKKPVTVTGPYLVYMLNDVDIVEDWTSVKKALAAPKRKHVDMVF